MSDAKCCGRNFSGNTQKRLGDKAEITNLHFLFIFQGTKITL